MPGSSLHHTVSRPGQAFFGIGMGPLGILLVGGLAAVTGPLLAIDAVSVTGFVLVCAIGAVWKRREKAVFELPR